MASAMDDSGFLKEIVFMDIYTKSSESNEFKSFHRKKEVSYKEKKNLKMLNNWKTPQIKSCLNQ